MSRLFIDSFRSSGLGKVSKSIARANKRYEARKRELKRREQAVFLKQQRIEVMNRKSDISKELLKERTLANKALLREKAAAKKSLMKEANELRKDKMRERERLIKERAVKKQIPEPRGDESLNDYLYRI